MEQSKLLLESHEDNSKYNDRLASMQAAKVAGSKAWIKEVKFLFLHSATLAITLGLLIFALFKESLNFVLGLISMSPRNKKIISRASEVISKMKKGTCEIFHKTKVFLSTHKLFFI